MASLPVHIDAFSMNTPSVFKRISVDAKTHRNFCVFESKRICVDRVLEVGLSQVSNEPQFV